MKKNSIEPLLLQEDATLAGYEAHLRAENAPPPMTNTERELAEVNNNNEKTNIFFM